MRANVVKQALRSGQPSVGTWLSLGSITAFGRGEPLVNRVAAERLKPAA